MVFGSGVRTRAGVRYFVCPEHESRLRRYHTEVDRFGGWFMALLGIFVMALVLFTMLESSVGVGLSVVFLGLVMIRFPFATPQTVQMIGVRASIWLARVGGVIILGLGIWQMTRPL